MTFMHHVITRHASRRQRLRFSVCQLELNLRKYFFFCYHHCLVTCRTALETTEETDNFSRRYERA